MQIPLRTVLFCFYHFYLFDKTRFEVDGTFSPPPPCTQMSHFNMSISRVPVRRRAHALQGVHNARTHAHPLAVLQAGEESFVWHPRREHPFWYLVLTRARTPRVSGIPLTERSTGHISAPWCLGLGVASSSPEDPTCK